MLKTFEMVIWPLKGINALFRALEKWIRMLPVLLRVPLLITWLILDLPFELLGIICYQIRRQLIWNHYTSEKQAEALRSLDYSCDCELREVFIEWERIENGLNRCIEAGIPQEHVGAFLPLRICLLAHTRRGRCR